MYNHKVLVVSGTEFCISNKGIDVIINFLAKKGISVDCLKFYVRDRKCNCYVRDRNIRQLYFCDFLGMYRDKFKYFCPGFLLLWYFKFLFLQWSKNNDLSCYDYIIIESGYPIFFGYFISKEKVIYRQSDEIKIAMNCNRSFFKRMEVQMMKKAIAISSAYPREFFPNQFFHKYTYWKTSYIPVALKQNEMKNKSFYYVGNERLDRRLIKKIMQVYPDYTYHVYGNYNFNITNVVCHGYQKFDSYIGNVKSSILCLTPRSYSFQKKLSKIGFTSKVLFAMSLGMPFITPRCGVFTKSIPEFKIYVYSNFKEALQIVAALVKEWELKGNDFFYISEETKNFLKKQTLCKKEIELETFFSNLGLI